MMARDRSDVIRSPAHGTSPMIGSQPKRIDVPGTRNASSSQWRSARNASMRSAAFTAAAFVSFVNLCALCAVGASESPSQKYGTHREAGADRGEQYELPLLQLPRAQCVVQRERYRRRRRIAEPLDVDDHLLRRQAELLGCRLDDPPVGLVRHEQIDVARREAV